jgi:hypothetical protein
MRWTIPLLLASSAVLAKGFSTADLGTAAQQAGNDRPAIERKAEADRLRVAMAFDAAAAIGMRSEQERVVLAAAFETGKPQSDARARWFMATAIPQGGVGNTTAFYNPLARGWLLLGWQQVDGAWRVRSAQFYGAGAPQWTKTSGPWLGAYVGDYVSARKQLGTAAPAMAAAVADGWMTGMAVWLADPARKTATTQARKLIASGDAAALGGRSIDLLPARVRNTFVPVAALMRSDGGAVLLASPLMPQLQIAADFDNAQKPALKRLTLVNLDQAENIR